MRKLVFLLLIITCFTSFSQTKIEVKVINSNNEVVPFANVLVFENQNQNTLITFGYTNEEGKLSLEIESYPSLVIECKSMGYLNQKKIFDVVTSDINLSFQLEDSTTELNEVIVYENIPLKVKKDTISYDASFYTYGQEQVVEDLLKNLPGVNVDSQGNITVNNIPIEKIMVDGDDLFEKGYTTLSKNMPVNPVDKVEVYKNYSNNKLLKDIEDSEKIALNLVLKEDSKRIWFGNFDANGSPLKFTWYSTKNNLMNFGKKNKVYVLSNFNNVGYDAIKDAQTLINSITHEGNSTLGNQSILKNYVNTSNVYTGFEDEKTNFNHLKFISINGITRPSNNIKLKSNILFGKDNSNFNYDYSESILSDSKIINNVAQNSYKKNKNLAFARLDYEHSLTDNSSLQISSKYQNFNTNSYNNFIFNDDVSDEEKSSKKQLYDAYLTYSNRINNNEVFLFNSRIINDKIPESISVNNFNYNGLLELNNIHELSQSYYSKLNASGFEGQFIKNSNDNVREIIFGNENNKSEFKSELVSADFQNIISKNDYTVFQNNFYIKYYYSIKSNKIKVRPYIELNYLKHRITSIPNSENTFFLTYGSVIEFSLNKNSFLTLNFNKNEHPTNQHQIFGEYILSNRNLLTKGVEENNQLIDHSISVNYNLSNYEGSSFVNFYFLINNYENYFSSNQFISQNYTLSESILLKDKKSKMLGVHSEFFINPLSSNLKVDLKYNSLEYGTMINTQSRLFNLVNLNSIAELKSGFKGFFNYQVGLNWSNQSINSSDLANFKNYIDLLFNIKNIQSKLTFERYQFDNISDTSTFHFINFTFRKSFKNNSDFSIEGINLTNTSKFKRTQISDIRNISSSFVFIPRYIMLGYKLRF